jgi:methylated-DNA-[protein]-cysteine S-methyltransferase
MDHALPECLTLGRLATPIGEALIVTDEEGRLCALDWSDFESRLLRTIRRHHGPATTLNPGPVPRRIVAAVEAYFSGHLTSLEGLPCRTGGTPFQREVWEALRKIPVGRTLSYGALAARIGRPKAVRAVGLANGANPIGVVVPCHRVIGANGTLTGYGGGLHRKRWLLAHEGVPMDEQPTLPIWQGYGAPPSAARGPIWQ